MYFGFVDTKLDLYFSNADISIHNINNFRMQNLKVPYLLETMKLNI